MSFIVFVSIIILLFLMYTQVEEYYSQLDPKLNHIKALLCKVHPAAKDLELYEGEKSYSINKEKIYLCLKDKDKSYYNMNTLIYVALHELAHCINKKDVGHTPEFHNTFNALLARATTIGIYNPNIKIPTDYCEY